MARIQTIDMKRDGILVTLKISEKEYEFLKPKSKNFLIIPSDNDALDETLTTGKLGNSNRIMLPNKILKKYEIKKLLKKVSSRIFESNGNKFLVIRLEGADIGIPVFEEG